MVKFFDAVPKRRQIVFATRSRDDVSCDRPSPIGRKVLVAEFEGAVSAHACFELAFVLAENDALGDSAVLFKVMLVEIDRKPQQQRVSVAPEPLKRGCFPVSAANKS